MRLFGVSFLWLLCGLGAVAGSAATAPVSRLYVFGDSYSDIGAGYVDGDGPTAVAYLAWRLGLTVTHARAPGAADKSLVFAVSGARSGEGAGAKAKGALLGYGMMNQVRDFAARVESGEIRFDPATTLFFFAGGLNDGKLPVETTIANLAQEIGILQRLGGRHFTVALLPVKIRGFAAQGIRLNSALIRLAEDGGKRLGVSLWLNHWGAYFDEVIEHPAAYGLVNVTDACAGRAIFDEDPTPVGDPATYYFYHAGHPSTAVHRIVGAKLHEELLARPSLP